jgi:hypothetical protein
MAGAVSAVQREVAHGRELRFYAVYQEEFVGVQAISTLLAMVELRPGRRACWSGAG